MPRPLSNNSRSVKKERQVIWHPPRVSRGDRERIKGHRSFIIWFTGLPSSGKSTIAHELEFALNKSGMHTYVLDGDNIRHALNSDLGFSSEERTENIRRVGEVAKLFLDAGVATIAAFISPFEEGRKRVRSSVAPGEFIEIYVKCPIEICKDRDPKGLYKKAMAGEIDDFTGIDHPYKEPRRQEIVIESDKVSAENAVAKILNYLKGTGLINKKEGI